jgi:hypothetical protein
VPLAPVLASLPVPLFGRLVPAGFPSPADDYLEGEIDPAKYRGPNGEEWTGRGRTPGWLAAFEAEGRSRDEFKA